MRSFESKYAIQFLQYLRNIRINFNAQHLTKGFMSFSSRSFSKATEKIVQELYRIEIRSGLLHGNISYLGLVNRYTKRHLTESVLGTALENLERREDSLKRLRTGMQTCRSSPCSTPLHCSPKSTLVLTRTLGGPVASTAVL